MRSMGLDIGDRRIGVALGDPLGIMASPLTIIECLDESTDIAAIINLIGQHQVRRVIVGLQISMDGSLGQQAGKVKTFVQELCRHTEVPVEFRDERLSTVSARRLARAAGKTRSVRHDAVAAALILQGYLDEEPS